MLDPFVSLAPILLLPVVALMGFTHLHHSYLAEVPLSSLAVTMSARLASGNDRGRTAENGKHVQHFKMFYKLPPEDVNHSF